MRTNGLGRLVRLLASLAVCVGVAFAVGAPVASALPESGKCGSITGSGSSLQNLAQKNVLIPYWEKTGWKEKLLSLVCEATAKITYEPTSSGKALAEWGDGGKLTAAESFNKEKLDEYIGTDVGPEGGPAGLAEGMVEAGTQIAEMDAAGKSNKVVTMPVEQSAISVIVTLPEGCSATGTAGAVVNMALWEEYKTHKIAFSTLVKGLTFSGTSCTNETLALARESSSGTTAGFKRYLDDLESTTYGPFTNTAAKSESASEWPTPLPDETGNGTGGNLAKKVFETVGANGAIGYADLADARGNGFTSAVGTPQKHTVGGKEVWSLILLVPNGGATLGSEGKAESPEASSEASNCEKALYPSPATVGPDVDWSRARQSNSTSGTTGVYPICTLTFDVAWENYSIVEWENPVSKATEKYSEEQFRTTSSFLHSIILFITGRNTELEEKHFAPLPKAVREEDEKGATMENIYWKEPNA